jgi:hypothetical protein
MKLDQGSSRFFEKKGDAPRGRRKKLLLFRDMGGDGFTAHGPEL